VRGVVLNTRDVTNRKLLEEKLRYQALHDPLTRLANRALFHECVGQALRSTVRGQHQMALAILDLDDFKRINDSLGHVAGDMVLIEAARRLIDCLRPQDTLARLGGDEFAVLLTDIRAEADVAAVVARLLASLRDQVVEVHGHTFTVTASAGVAIGGGDAMGTEVLLRNADVAMYAAKARGQGQHEFYRMNMHAALLGRQELDAELLGALERQEFVVHYQPIVELASGHPIGVEALVRWQHSKRGLVRPDLFIPRAEETGLIVPLGRWVLREACRQAQQWNSTAGQRTQYSLSVNVSTCQLQDDNIVDDVAAALADAGLDPRLLTLEITESSLLHDTPLTLGRLRRLKALGPRIAIDDFGTGYSSFAYLQRLTVDVLKIDKSFIDGLGHDRGAAIVRSILDLANRLGVQAVAEGVEAPSQVVRLQELGGSLAQGYLFARPADAVAVTAYLDAHSSRANRRAVRVVPAPVPLPTAVLPTG